MTDAERARALSGVLGERARKACQGCRKCVTDVEERIRRPWWDTDICGGSGWRSALLLPEERCPGNPGRPGEPCRGVDEYGEYEHTYCGGSGTIQRWDEGLLREALEEAGCRVAYGTLRKFEVRVTRDEKYHFGDGPILAVAACEALKVEVPHANP